MILFAADNHYGAHPGKTLMEQIKNDYDIAFFEDDWRCFESGNLYDKYGLVILNLIAGTCDIPPPTQDQANNVKAYLERGGNLLLLHGASAAFWPHDWWRKIVGFRWVRGNDPDGVAGSTHPHRPFDLKKLKVRHELIDKLREIELPKDEVYINLEQTSPAMLLMHTVVEEGDFVQCYETPTAWGGSIVGYIPGHKPEVVQHPAMIANCKTLIDYLSAKKAGNA